MTSSLSELHGKLPDGQPCELILSEDSFVLKVADHSVGVQQAMAEIGVTDPLVIGLANGQSATLSGNYYVGYNAQIGPGSAFVLKRIGANRVLVGPRAFGDRDRVNSIRFRPTNEFIAEYYVNHRGNVRVNRGCTVDTDQLFTPSPEWGNVIIDAIDGQRLTICQVEEGNVSISLRVEISEMTTQQGTRTKDLRVAEISYRDPVTIDVAVEDVVCLCHFFSFTTGIAIAPTEVSIQSGPENHVGIRPTFEFRTRFRPGGADLDPNQPHRCLISHPIDGTDYEASLGKWFSRRQEWRHSYNLGSDCLARENEISRHRYLDAVNWFESIPQFYHKDASPLSTDIIARAAAKAAVVFRESGITESEVSEARLLNLLAPVNAPSLSARLKLAVAHIRERFGQDALPAASEGLVSRAVSLRGKFSHGAYALESHEFKELYECILLIELVCGFLTLSGLPWVLPRLARAHFHPMQRASVALSQFATARARGLRRSKPRRQ